VQVAGYILSLDRITDKEELSVTEDMLEDLKLRYIPYVVPREKYDRIIISLRI
jgi:hypothetical protein